METFVSDEDYEMLANYRWRYSPSRGEEHGYVCTDMKVDGKYRIVLMHRFLMQTPKGMETDHINRNKLDNRRENLRIVTRQQNQWNKGLPGNNKSGFLGVSWSMRDKVYVAHITISGKAINLGCSKNAEEASRLYQNAVLQMRGI
jgi:hypothetical protein